MIMMSRSLLGIAISGRWEEDEGREGKGRKLRRLLRKEYTIIILHLYNTAQERRFGDPTRRL